MIEVALTDVCDFQGGTQPPKSEWSKEPSTEHIRMLQIRDFTQGKKEHVEYVKNKKTLKTCNENDILIGRYGASIGKILTGLSGAYNVAIVKTIPDKEQIHRDFLLYLLKGETFQRFICNVGSRAAQAGFNKKELTKFKFMLPSLAEQQKIAAILDAADQLRQKDQQLIEHYTRLGQALFLEMFGDPVGNPLGWETNDLEHLSKIQGGLQVSVKRQGLPLVIDYLRVANVHRNALNLDEIKKISITTSELDRVLLEKDDLLVVEGHGNKDEIGRVGIWDDSIKPMVHQNHLIRVRADREKINPVFLCYYLNSQGGRLSMIRASNTTSGLNTISTKIVKNTTCITPSLPLQNQFAQHIKAIEQQKQSAQASLEKSESLFNSLLQRAFRGELTG